jgi:Icc-related predicted phosphoesterase
MDAKDGAAPFEARGSGGSVLRLLLLSDLHGQAGALSALERQIAEADLILLAGDITDFGGAAELRSLLLPLDGKSSKVAAVGGNCDKQSARKHLEEEGLSVDGGYRSFVGALGRLTVVGAGGGSFHTGLTPYERKDVELMAAIENAMRDIDEARESPDILIGLSHTPPRGTEADLRHGGHVGSRNIRNMLDALAPLAWVCGHIHESRSVSRCGSTLVVNPGPLREGFYAEALISRKAGHFSIEATLLQL